MKFVSLLIANVLAFAHGQGIVHNHGTHAEVHGDIGVYNGQLVALDDITDRSRLNSFTQGLGLTQGQWGVNRQLSGGLVLGGVRFETDGTGFIGAVGGVGVAGGVRLPKCQRQACKKQRIPTACRYTPVLRSLSGQHCLGCPENVCTVYKPSRKTNRRQRHRQRRRQQRLCKLFGQCFGLNKNGPIGKRLFNNGSMGRNILGNGLVGSRFSVFNNGQYGTGVLNNRIVGNGLLNIAHDNRGIGFPGYV